MVYINSHISRLFFTRFESNIKTFLNKYTNNIVNKCLLLKLLSLQRCVLYFWYLVGKALCFWNIFILLTLYFFYFMWTFIDIKGIILQYITLYIVFILFTLYCFYFIYFIYLILFLFYLLNIVFKRFYITMSSLF